MNVFRDLCHKETRWEANVYDVGQKGSKSLSQKNLKKTNSEGIRPQNVPPNHPSLLMGYSGTWPTWSSLTLGGEELNTSNPSSNSTVWVRGIPWLPGSSGAHKWEIHVCPSTPPPLNGIQQRLGVKTRFEKTQFPKMVEFQWEEYCVLKKTGKVEWNGSCGPIILSTNCIPVNVSILQDPGYSESSMLSILGRLGRKLGIFDSTLIRAIHQRRLDGDVIKYARKSKTNAPQ